MSQSSAEPTALVVATAALVAGLTGLLASAGSGPAVADPDLWRPAVHDNAAPVAEAPPWPPGPEGTTGAPARSRTATTAGAGSTVPHATDPPPPPAAAEARPGVEDGRARVADLCRRIGAKLGSVSESDCRAIDFRFDGARSVLGAPLVAADFEPEGTARGRVLLLGGIHGDEYSSVSIVFRWLEALAVDDALGGLQWRIIPLLNPDGLLRPRSQRMNERGVDLNRNFPTDNWDEDATDYWVRRTGRNPRRYPGPEPLSEPESRYLLAQIQSYAPDLIVAVHAPLEVVDFDGPPEPPDQLGSLYLHRMGTYPGSLGRYGGEQLGLPVVTIELSSAGIMPPRAEVREIWRDLVDYARRTLVFEGGASIAAEPTAGANLR